jgi:hypothetical protein
MNIQVKIRVILQKIEIIRRRASKLIVCLESGFDNQNFEEIESIIFLVELLIKHYIFSFFKNHISGFSSTNDDEQWGDREVDWERDLSDISAISPLENTYKIADIFEEINLSLEFFEDNLKGLLQTGNINDPILLDSSLEVDQITSLVELIFIRLTELYRLSLSFTKYVDPQRIELESFLKEVSTPLRIENFTGSLHQCTNCGSTLTSDDKTFDGMYCENCRTRWILK